MFVRNQTRRLLLTSVSLTAVFAITFPPSTWAQDRQGKRSLETSRSRPKENKPAQTGSQRVQEKTQNRTKQSLEKSDSARQQEKTNKSVLSAIRK
jgi:hypothetical protein